MTQAENPPSPQREGGLTHLVNTMTVYLLAKAFETIFSDRTAEQAGHAQSPRQIGRIAIMH
jgi:hypothetical protein